MFVHGNHLYVFMCICGMHVYIFPCAYACEMHMFVWSACVSACVSVREYGVLFDSELRVLITSILLPIFINNGARVFGGQNVSDSVPRRNTY